MEQCLSLISVIKDRWDASSPFLEEKETIFRALNTLEPILRDASTASVQHTEALKGVLNNLEKALLIELIDVFVDCEEHTIWSTWVRPNKYKGMLVNLISKLDVAIAAIYYELGEANRNQRQYPKSIEFHQKALDIRLKMLDKNDVKIGYGYNCLGLVYDSQGNYSKALEYHEKSLVIYKKTLGAEHPDVGTSYNNLGIVYWKHGDNSKALEYYEKSLAI